MINDALTLNAVRLRVTLAQFGQVGLGRATRFWLTILSAGLVCHGRHLVLIVEIIN